MDYWGGQRECWPPLPNYWGGLAPLAPLFLRLCTFCQALDSGKEMRAVFCDTSISFDRVWHAVYLVDFTQLVSQETFMLGLQIIFPIENNELLFQVLFLTGPTVEPGFLRDRSLALFFFCCISMILFMTSAQIFDCLQTILVFL